MISTLLGNLVNSFDLESYGFWSQFIGFLNSQVRALHQIATFVLSSSASFSRELQVVVWSCFDSCHYDLSLISVFPFPGPRLFLSCPIDVDGSRVWFTDLWNYSIIPYLLEAVREGLQVSRQKWKIISLKMLSIQKATQHQRKLNNYIVFCGCNFAH